ncbi:MAG: carbohydrate-binding domain-containing protein [Thermoflexales bacterium]|nr:carbohydrate-binding domain-containing protein [Thermoflexales bacterium]
MKKSISLFLSAILIVTLTACSAGTVESTGIVPASQPPAQPGQPLSLPASTSTPAATLVPISVKYERDDLAASESASDTSYIKLEGASIAFEGSGVIVHGSTVSITSAGVYNLSGVLNDGQIVVDTEDEESVVLVLDGADITCLSSAPIYVSNADKVVITLAEGTENRLTDGASYVFADAESDEPNAALFSKDDLTINGSGSLTVNANYNNGIASKDDLKITGGRLTVNAANDGIKGRDSIAVKDGTVTVNAGADGLQANNDEDVEKGTIAIEGGTLDITAGLDGIQAQTRLLVSGGTLVIVSGGGSLKRATDSAKGLKAGLDLTITGGAVTIDAADDAIHSNGSLTIGGGDIRLASGDDGVHSDATLNVGGGTLRITKSYEGLESAAITINAGTIQLVASDDGINAAGGVDGSSINGRMGQNPFAACGDCKLDINGGYIAVDAAGDGLDINGPITMSGGTVLINGPIRNDNGALDYTGAFNITGGLLVAVGSAGMAQAPSASSTQYSLAHTFPSAQAAGTLVHVKAQDGQEILTFVPAKAYQSLVFSSPKLANGATYLVYTGGSSSGTLADGLYSGGAYTAGVQVASYTISGMVTGAGQGWGGFRRGGGGGGGAPPPRP